MDYRLILSLINCSQRPPKWTTSKQSRRSSTTIFLATRKTLSCALWIPIMSIWQQNVYHSWSTTMAGNTCDCGYLGHLNGDWSLSRSVLIYFVAPPPPPAHCVFEIPNWNELWARANVFLKFNQIGFHIIKTIRWKIVNVLESVDCAYVCIVKYAAMPIYSSIASVLPQQRVWWSVDWQLPHDWHGKVVNSIIKFM